MGIGKGYQGPLTRIRRGALCHALIDGNQGQSDTKVNEPSIHQQKLEYLSPRAALLAYAKLACQPQRLSRLGGELHPPSTTAANDALKDGIDNHRQRR